MSPACRTPNAAIPPFARGNHHLARHHRPTQPPTPGHNSPQPRPRPPPATAHRPTPRRPTGGFAPLDAPALPRQPPPRPPPATAHRPRRWWPPRPAHAAANAGPHPATTRPNQPQPRPPGHARSPARPATDHRPTPRRPTGGFAPLDAPPTACRRRVAPLMLQFPPLARANHGHARHQRRPTRPRPRASQSPGATGAPFKPYPLFRQNEIRPIQFVQTATN